MKHSFLLYLLSIFTAYCANAQDKKVTKFVNEYSSVAFSKVQEKYLPLIKWPSDTKLLKYKIVGELHYMNNKSWSRFISEINKLSQISLVETSKDDFDLLIYFGSLQSYKQYTGIKIPYNTMKFNNWSNRSWNKNYELTKASFCIVPSMIKDTNEGKYRLKNGMMKSLGLLGEMENSYSIFHKYSTPTNTKLTQMDKRFIKLHYNNSLKSGFNEENIKEILFNFSDIEEILKEKL